VVDFSANLLFSLHPFFKKKKKCGHLITRFGENLYNVSLISIVNESLHFCKSALKEMEPKENPRVGFETCYVILVDSNFTVMLLGD
jgi:hypothetical protein